LLFLHQYCCNVNEKKKRKEKKRKEKKRKEKKREEKREVKGED